MGCITMKAGDLVFFRNKGIIPALIRKVTNGYYNHVAIALSENLLLESEYNSNTVIRNISFYHVKESEIRVVETNATEEQVAKLYKITDEYYSTKFYDLKLIVKMFIKNVLHIPFKTVSRDKVVCSELAGMVMLDTGMDDNYDIMMLDPQELYEYAIKKYENKI